jgi:hypothetical protein
MPGMGYRRADGVVSEVLDGCAMLVAPDGTELITLDPTGIVVWDALEESRSRRPVPVHALRDLTRALPRRSRTREGAWR